MNNSGLIKIAMVVALILGLSYWFFNSQKPTLDPANVSETIKDPLPIEKVVSTDHSRSENDTNNQPDQIQSNSTEILNSAINLLPEPDHGTAEYLDARELAVEKFPNDPIKVLRHRLTGTDFSQIYSLLEAVLQSEEGRIGPYDLSFFDDIPCTFDRATTKQRSSGTWVIDAQCTEYFRSNLTIIVSPEKLNFAATLSYQGRKIQLSKLTEQFAVVLEYDPTSWPKNNH